MMKIEKTSTAVIFHEPDMDVKEKVLRYFALDDPVREYFVYSGQDPNKRKSIFRGNDILYVPSGFLKINDPVIKKLHMIRNVAPKPPKVVDIKVDRTPRSDLQRDCIKILTESKSPKITVELKPGTGKMEPYSRMIPTPTESGYTLMGNLKVGDYVFGRDGEPTEVTGIFEHGVQDVYKITFQDGRTAYCGADHLWTVKTFKDGAWKTVSTADMMRDFKRLSPWKEAHGRSDPYNYKYYIPVCEPVAYPTKDVPIDPWVLGCFIGNGCCTLNALTISSPTSEIPERIATICGYTTKKASEGNFSYVFYNNGKLVHTKDFFKDIPEMIGEYSRDKSIPIQYLINDFNTRLNLLRGLMDTDGCISYNEGRYTLRYTSCSLNLLNQIKWLLYSFGYSGNVIIDSRTDEKYHDGFCGSVIFRVPNSVKHEFFLMPKKRFIAEQATSAKQENIYADLLIKNIEFSHREQCRCIMVDNPEHLYLTEDFIVTHNTFIATYSISKLHMKPLIVVPTTLLKNQWIENLEECGIPNSDIAKNIYDAPNKKFCVVTISSIENALRDDWDGLWRVVDQAGFGIKIIDEAHLHLKGMLRFDSLCNIKHNWYLSATLGRSSDDEDRILNNALLDAERFIGNSKYEEYQKEYICVHLQDIHYNIPRCICDEKFKYGKKGLIRATYYQALMEYGGGVPFMKNIITMVKKAKAISKSDKKILLLLPMISIIERALKYINADPFFKNMNVVMVDGSISIAEKSDRLVHGDLILSTTQSMGTGVDVKDLVAVVNFDQLASPITSEQIVGRLRDRGYQTYYFDICDHVKYAKTISNWGKRRRQLYPYFPGVDPKLRKLPDIYC